MTEKQHKEIVRLGKLMGINFSFMYDGEEWNTWNVYASLNVNEYGSVGLEQGVEKLLIKLRQIARDILELK